LLRRGVSENDTTPPKPLRPKHTSAAPCLPDLRVAHALVNCDRKAMRHRGGTMPAGDRAASSFGITRSGRSRAIEPQESYASASGPCAGSCDR
jgi:hypothetical protein